MDIDLFCDCDVPAATRTALELNDVRPSPLLLPTTDALSYTHERLSELVLAPLALLAFRIICIKPDTPLYSGFQISYCAYICRSGLQFGRWEKLPLESCPR